MPRDREREALLQEQGRLEAKRGVLEARSRTQREDPQAVSWLHELELVEAHLARIDQTLEARPKPRWLRRLRWGHERHTTPMDRLEQASDLARSEAAARNNGRLGGGFF